MATIAEQVAQDVARGLYSPEVGQQILQGAGLTAPQIASGVVGNPSAGAAFGTNPMQRAGGASSWGTNVPTTAIATPGSVNVGPVQAPTPFVLPPSHPNNPLNLPPNTVSAGPTNGQISDDGKQIYDSSAMGGAGGWIPNPDFQSPSTNIPIVSPKTEADQYLDTLLQSLDADGITETYNDHLRQLVTYYQNDDLSQEQVQSYVDKLGGVAVGNWADTNPSGLENFLTEVYDLFSPQGPTFYDQWLTDTLNYSSIAIKEKDVIKIQDNAGKASDVNSFINALFTDAMEKGNTWEEALNNVSTALWESNKDWATANDGAGFPGLSGQIGNLNSPEDVKQWLHGAYQSLDATTKTNLVSAYPDKGPDLSNVYSTFAIAAAPATQVAADGSITAYDSKGTATTVFPEGNKTAEEVATGMGFTLADPKSSSFLDPSGGPTQVASGTQTPTAVSTASGIYDPFFEDSQRTFGDVYRPFTATQAGYNMPGIQSAYASARAPLSTQYSMQLPDLQVSGGEIGLDPKYQSADEFLRSLTGGTGQILRGGDLYSRLQDISGALASDPMAMGMDPRAQLYQKQFGDTTQQASAFAQPFLMATRGSPEARSALTQSIAKAAEQFDYQNPMGAPAAAGGRQGFLGWAMENNLLGINDMFTAQQRNPANQSMPISDQFRGTGSDLTFSPDWNTYQYQE